MREHFPHFLELNLGAIRHAVASGLWLVADILRLDAGITLTSSANLALTWLGLDILVLKPALS